jgi:hypothetical protein
MSIMRNDKPSSPPATLPRREFLKTGAAAATAFTILPGQ